MAKITMTFEDKTDDLGNAGCLFQSQIEGAPAEDQPDTVAMSFGSWHQTLQAVIARFEDLPTFLKDAVNRALTTLETARDVIDPLAPKART